MRVLPQGQNDNTFVVAGDDSSGADFEDAGTEFFYLFLAEAVDGLEFGKGLWPGEDDAAEGGGGEDEEEREV
jgi:hypothetical protein